MPAPNETDADALRAAVVEMRASAESMKSSAVTMTDQVTSAVGAVRSLGVKIDELSERTDKNARDIQNIQLAATRPRQTTLTELAAPAPDAPPGAPPLSSSIRAIENTVRGQASKGESRLLTLAILVAMIALEVIRNR